MPHLIRARDGYIDPIMAVVPMATILVVGVNPRLVAAIGDGFPVGLRAWIVALAIVAVVLLVQGAAIAVCLGEAYQDARSRGERVGFNQAPALQGKAAPFAMALVYIVGLWPLIRVEPRPTWAIALNGVVAGGILAGGLLAAQNGAGSLPEQES